MQRFLCLACRRSFSTQTFRLDYRLKRPELLVPHFWLSVSKVTHRQSARMLDCARTTEERHFQRLSAHCKAFHEAKLRAIEARGGLGRSFLFDELQTFEAQRTRKPVTVPVLIERRGFVLDARTGSLAIQKRRPQWLEPRPDESKRLTLEAFGVLRRCASKQGRIELISDEKSSYPTSLRALFGERCRQIAVGSKRPRTIRNPLWPVNHTLARMRDGVSRLVRRTWGVAKKHRFLHSHIGIWICYRNYIRRRVNYERRTPAMALGLERDFWTVPRLLRWRVFHAP